MLPIVAVRAVRKAYDSGLVALHGINLDIAKGEIFALLGPNGAGKTTLISIICGTVTMTSGSVSIDGHDTATAFRAARSRIGLVPQEIAVDIFQTVWNTVTFSRRLFGQPTNPAYIESLLRDLSLWDKRKSRIIELSGGMKRRVMIAKALSHEPDVLFLDEPTAGVDVTLRKDMWDVIRRLKDRGVTVILTTHYIEEAEAMADRVGVIDKGRIVLVDEKVAMMQRLGKRQLTLTLVEPMTSLPLGLADWPLELDGDGHRLTYRFDASAATTGIQEFIRRVDSLGIAFSDLDTKTSSLEEIFVGLLERAA